MEIIAVDNTNLKYLEDFLSNDLPSTFRYFNKRSIECIKNHLITLVVKIDNCIIGYSHIDKEDNIYWFGICILDKYQNQGIGSKIMQYILNCENTKNLKICLTVDIVNIGAIKLYQKYGFKIVNNPSFKGDYYHYMENK